MQMPSISQVLQDSSRSRKNKRIFNLFLGDGRSTEKQCFVNSVCEPVNVKNKLQNVLLHSFAVRWSKQN